MLRLFVAFLWGARIVRWVATRTPMWGAGIVRWVATRTPMWGAGILRWVATRTPLRGARELRRVVIVVVVITRVIAAIPLGPPRAIALAHFSVHVLESGTLLGRTLTLTGIWVDDFYSLALLVCRALALASLWVEDRAWFAGWGGVALALTRLTVELLVWWTSGHLFALAFTCIWILYLTWWADDARVTFTATSLRVEDFVLATLWLSGTLTLT